MKHIVIVGGGFGGITAALELERLLGRSPAVRLTLIDREAYQLYPPNLYEICTAEEELASLTDLKHSITVPIAEILRGRSIDFVQGEVTAIDAERRTISLRGAGPGQDSGQTGGQGAGQPLEYDYLVLALGSTSNSYGIPGVEEYAIPLKSVNDALRIRDKIEFAVQVRRYDMTKLHIRIAVAGGGFAGVEVAAELQKFLDFVAWKNNFPREKIETLLIEGSNRILNGLDDAVARDVAARLHDLGVRVQVSSFVTKVGADFLEFKNGERLEYDCLIWTAGVKASAVPLIPAPRLDSGGRVVVDGFFHPMGALEVVGSLRAGTATGASGAAVAGASNIFIIGDACNFADPAGHPLPGTIPQAEDQAKFVARALAAQLAGHQPKPYFCRQFGYIIPVGGKWAVLKLKRLYITGWLAYAIREFVAWRWFAGLIGPWKALRLIYFDEKIYSRND